MFVARCDKSDFKSFQMSRSLKSLQMHKHHDSGMMQFARTVYEADCASTIRFQGTYANGGVDTDSGLYWVSLTMLTASMAGRLPCTHVGSSLQDASQCLCACIPP